MNYNDSVKTLQSIRTEYLCKGEVIFKVAIQNVIEYGQYMLTKDYLNQWLKRIDEKHDTAEVENKILYIGRDFEKAIAECTVKIAEIPAIYFLMYIQREVWFYNPDKYSSGEISYVRAIDLLHSIISYSLQDRETDIAREDLDYIGFEDDELRFLGYKEVFFNDED